MNLSAHSVSHVGSRTYNEDAVQVINTDNALYVIVSDGAGGHHNGALASATAVEQSASRLQQLHALSPAALGEVVDEVQAHFDQIAPSSKDVRANMCATISMVGIDKEHLHAAWAQLGDTRIYLFRRGRAKQIGHDHSVVQALVDAGFVQKHMLRDHPQRSVLTAALGIKGEAKANVSTEFLTIENGDALLLCTDGFWETLDEVDMEKALRSASSEREWLDIMSHQITEQLAEGKDNFSAIAVWCGDTGDVTLKM